MGDFDLSIVNSCSGKVETDYYDIYFEMHDRVQNEFINQMQDKWACEKAQNFFNNDFKGRMESLIININSLYRYIIDVIFDEADSWARSTDWEFYPGTFETYSPYFDTSCIRTEINGIKGIDLDKSMDVVNILRTLKANAEYFLKRTRETINGCIFIDENKKEYIFESIDDVKTNLYNSLAGVFEDTEKYIKKTVEDYKDTRGIIERSFNEEN